MIRVAALAVEIIRGGQPDRVKRDLKDVDRAGAKAGKSVLGLNNVLKAVGIGFSVVAITRGLRSVAKSFLDFDSAMVESLAIMGDVSATMRDKMGQAAKDVARTTTFSATEAAQSYFYLASAGLDAQQSIAALPQVAKFAQAGMFDMARATDLATDAQSALGLTVDDASQNLTNLTRVTDVLVKANTIANAKVEEFSESLTNKAGAALKIVGKDIEEGVAVLAAFADQGLKGAEAGTALNIVFTQLKDKALKNKEEFAALGVAVFDATGDMRNSADIIADLERALAGMSDEQKAATLAQLGFTTKSIAFIQTIIGQSDAIRAYEEELRKAGGTTEEVANKQLQSFKSQLKLTTDTLQSLIITMVETVMPMLGFQEGLATIRGDLEGMERAMVRNREEMTVWMRGFGALWQTFITMPIKVAFNSIQLFFGAVTKTIMDLLAFVASGVNTIASLVNPVLKLLSHPIKVMTFDVEKMRLASGLLGDSMVRDLDQIKDAIEGTAEAWALFDLAERGFFPQRPRRDDRPSTDGEPLQPPGPPPPGPRPPGQPEEAIAPKIGFDPTDPFGLRRKPTVGMKGPGKAIGVVTEAFEQVTAETLQMIDDMAGTIEFGLEETIGDAIFNGLEAAFETGNLKSFFEHFGKTLLAGFGDILVQLGKILIQYGLTMEALRPFLTNIFTAGPAAIAAGMALIALGSAFTAITSSGGGGVGRGSATAGAFREPRYGFSQQHEDITRQTIDMGPAPNVQPQPTLVFHNVWIGPDDPRVQREMGELVRNAVRRGIQFS